MSPLRLLALSLLCWFLACARHKRAPARRQAAAPPVTAGPSVASPAPGARSPEVSPADLAFVRAWFVSKEKGTPELPEMLFVDQEPATRSVFLNWLDDKNLFHLADHTPIDYVDGAGAAAFPGRKTRTIVVRTGKPPPGCSEECEGFEWIEFTLNDATDELLALLVSAAACPFVESGVGDEPLVPRGEILRNLFRPALEATQDLPLDVGDCTRPIHVRLLEKKRELTMLDEIHLAVGGRALAPDACAGTGGDACRDDGVYLRLAQGQVLDLTFTIPPEVACSGAVLVANGHYVRLP